MERMINGITYTCDSKYAVRMELIESRKDFDKVRIDIDFGALVRPEPVLIRWAMPGHGVYTRWSPMSGQNRRLNPNWTMLRTGSRSASGMPLQCYLDSGDDNCITVALSDVKTPMEICSGVSEETGEIAWKLILFSQQTSQMDRYSVEMIVDTRRQNWQTTVSQVCEWWESNGYPVEEKDACAFEPLYSTWYSYHQNVTHDALIAELKEAAKLGMKVVIVDDGWQTDDSSRGYAYCGVWEPAATKIPEMKRFTQDVHNLGMKLMLWYSVPFVGVHSEVFDRFQGKYLYNYKGTDFVLDPRFPDVRQYLVDSYAHAVTDWNIDGMKLDFIDSFSLKEDSLDAHPDMDILSLEDAVCTLLQEIHDRLKEIKPDILIEFRQTYVGPIMQKYGDMLRAGDCPMDSVQNRVQTMDLRLTSGKTAVHSDMLMWHYTDSPESAAEQIVNVLFTVPQISVRLKEITPEQAKMLKFYLDFWQAHKDVFLHGELIVKQPASNYSMAVGVKDQTAVAVAYADRCITVPEQVTEICAVNGTGRKGLILDLGERSGAYSYRIFNCLGEVADSGYGVQPLAVYNVPVSGLLEVKLEA